MCLFTVSLALMVDHTTAAASSSTTTTTAPRLRQEGGNPLLAGSVPQCRTVCFRLGVMALILETEPLINNTEREWLNLKLEL